MGQRSWLEIRSGISCPCFEIDTLLTMCGEPPRNPPHVPCTHFFHMCRFTRLTIATCVDITCVNLHACWSTHTCKFTRVLIDTRGNLHACIYTKTEQNLKFLFYLLYMNYYYISVVFFHSLDTFSILGHLILCSLLTVVNFTLTSRFELGTFWWTFGSGEHSTIIPRSARLLK